MTDNAEIYRERLLRGLYTRVARKLGLSKSGRAHVCRVVKGERQSPRVKRAVEAELARISRLVEKRKAAVQKQKPSELERAA